MLRLITSILGTLSIIGGLFFLVLTGISFAVYWGDWETLRNAFSVSEAQAYGVAAIACFCFALVINLADISNQLDKVLDGLATIANDEETDAGS